MSNIEFIYNEASAARKKAIRKDIMDKGLSKYSNAFNYCNGRVAVPKEKQKAIAKIFKKHTGETLTF